MALIFLHKTLVQNYSYVTSFNPSLNLRFYSKINTPVQRDYIESLFRSYGFTENQITSLISKKPVILSDFPDPEKTLKPKLDFFNSVGMSPSYLHTILSLDTKNFKLSLENQIIPSYEYLKSFLHTTENVNHSIKRSSALLRRSSHRYIQHNIDVLRESGVPMDRILKEFRSQPRLMIQKTDRLVEIIVKIKDMGFDPRLCYFVSAIRTISGIEFSNWEKKKEIYRKWGWSDEEILAAFQKAPTCMAASEKKIDTVMDFLVNKMGWSLADVAENPYVINFSLKNWIVPRCLVYQFLLSEGLITKKRLATLICVKKELFNKAYVDPYIARFPELLTISKPKDNIQSLL